MQESTPAFSSRLQEIALQPRMEDIRRDRAVCFNNFQNPYSSICFIPFAGFSPKPSQAKGLTAQAPTVWLADC
jgi:hypothetical protein